MRNRINGEVAAFVIGSRQVRGVGACGGRTENCRAIPIDFVSATRNRLITGDNPDFGALRRRDSSGVLNSPELAKLFPALKPIAFGNFKKYGITERDGEEIFSNCLQKLTMPKASGSNEGQTTLDTLTVFEEVFPFFSKIVQNETVDRIRRVSALKNQANTSDSFEGLQEDEDRPMQFADPDSLEDGDMPDFGEIYALCSDTLDESEWKLIATLYMGDGVTKKELLEQDDFLEEMGIKKGSHITRWRGLSKKLEFALGKMRNRLEKEGYFFGNAAAALR